MAAFLSKQWWREFFYGKEEAEFRGLTDSAAAMEQGLMARRDAVTTQMAIASQTRAKLADAMARYERMRVYVERMLREGREDLANQAALQASAAKEQMDKLATQYESQRGSADRAIQVFRAAEAKVKERRGALPELETQVRINQLLLESNRVLSSYDVRSSAAVFDRTAERIRLHAGKLDAALLLEDVGAEIAQLEIGKAVREQDARAILDEIRSAAALPDTARPAALPAPVDRARALLSGPAFSSLAETSFGTPDRRAGAIDADYVLVPATVLDAESRKE